ncbi:MAG: NAD-dependent epimerase/dehydratase family protein [Gammaproteobacteria bacterium]|nr:NAD-dependent epimerase/dehydratase family protein [Gammaproteobacteria bacterium]
MKTLITGATGFVGSAVARELIRAGHELRTLTRASSDQTNLTGLAVESVTGDLTDRSSIEKAIKGCKALFHVAADYRLWSHNPNDIYRTNVNGTMHLMMAALEAGVERIVYTSSVATLGINRDRSPANEETPVNLEDMIGHYKRSKFMAEREVQRLIQERGLAAVIVNPSTPIGPRDVKPTPTGRMIQEAVRGSTPAYVDTGLNIVHVDDVARGHLLAYQRGTVGERYVLGGTNMSLKEILTQIARIVGRRPPLIRLPHNAVLPVAYISQSWARLRSAGEPRVTVEGVRLARKFMYFSSAKAERALGYQAGPAYKALQDAVEWFQQA